MSPFSSRLLSCSGTMGFGEELWCHQGHAALLRLQDSELRLMEIMKKWMTQRAKSDREFSVQLHQMAAMVEKLEGPQAGGGLDYISQLHKVYTYPCWTSFNLIYYLCIMG